jgi:hypothetical protein
MSQIIEEACLKVARTNMWDSKPADAAPIIQYQQELVSIAKRALKLFEGLGAKEQDIADAIHYIEQVYSMPPIRNNLTWFDETLFTILQPAFPNGGVDGEAARFAAKLISGIQKQIK